MQVRSAAMWRGSLALGSMPARQQARAASVLESTKRALEALQRIVSTPRDIHNERSIAHRRPISDVLPGDHDLSAAA
jgi:hypothetical protein